MKVRRWGGLFLILIFSTSAFAAELGSQLQLHGFGGWQYGRTDENHYLLGSDEGHYEHAQFALTSIANPYERLSVVAQLHFEQEEEGTETELDLVFAEWFFSDLLKFRIGKVKQPFGIYTEVFHVGTVRPFLTLPEGVYGASGLVAEAFNGIGWTGEFIASSGWGVAYDLYGGELIVGDSRPWEALAVPPPLELEGEDPLKETIGGRLVFITSVPGFSVGLSGYSGEVEAEEGEPDPGRTSVYGAHLDYNAGGWTARAEYVRKKEGEGLEQAGAYGELSYRWTAHWQTAARYDWGKADLPDPIPAGGGSLVEHKDWTFALNYWFNPSFVLKGELHLVDGNRFAVPEEIVPGEPIETKTRLFMVGANFSF
jgi:hypothetical protein